MKVKAHIRVARDPKRRTASPRIVATMRPMPGPLLGHSGDVLPTVAFAVEFDIPDSMFKRAEEVIATVVIPEDQVEIAAEVRQP